MNGSSRSLFFPPRFLPPCLLTYRSEGIITNKLVNVLSLSLFVLLLLFFPALLSRSSASDVQFHSSLFFLLPGWPRPPPSSSHWIIISTGIVSSSRPAQLFNGLRLLYTSGGRLGIQQCRTGQAGPSVCVDGAKRGEKENDGILGKVRAVGEESTSSAHQ